MYRSSIYRAGSERLHALGALDCALWDIKGKALDAPVYQLLGGRARNHVECYHSFGLLPPKQARDEARKAMADGFRAIGIHGVPTPDNVFDARRAIDSLVVEQGLIDYLRTSIPNCGGITTYRTLAALCEAHSVTLVPHFTGPLATTAVVHSLLAFGGAALNEVFRPELPQYLPESYMFRDGKMHASDRPGLGVVLDESRLNLVAEFTEARPAGLYQGQSLFRPDGSYLYL